MKEKILENEQYMQITEYIIEKIEDGEFKRGKQILSEHKLSKMFEVNRYTVRKAIERLKKLGYLYSLQGKGCYVSEKSTFIDYPVRSRGNFSDNLSKLGKEYNNKLLSWELADPSHKEKKKLELEDDDQVYKLTILRYVDDEPIAVYMTVLPEKLVPNLEVHLENFTSLHKILKEEYEYYPTCKNYSIETTFPMLKDILRLNIPADFPLFITNTINILNSGDPIEYTIVRIRGDRCKFYMDFTDKS